MFLFFCILFALSIGRGNFSFQLALSLAWCFRGIIGAGEHFFLLLSFSVIFFFIFCSDCVCVCFFFHSFCSLLSNALHTIHIPCLSWPNVLGSKWLFLVMALWLCSRAFNFYIYSACVRALKLVVYVSAYRACGHHSVHLTVENKLEVRMIILFVILLLLLSKLLAVAYHWFTIQCKLYWYVCTFKS